MSSKTEPEVGENKEDRMAKREYMARVAKRAGVPLRVATTVFDAAVEELLEVTSEGKRLTLAGFGRFYLQPHKGHKVRFASDPGGAVVDDYAVLKFSATREVNRRVGGGEVTQVKKTATKKIAPKKTTAGKS